MRFKSVALTVVVAILLAACGGGSGDAEGSKNEEGLTEVSLRLDFLFGSDHAGYFVALEKGYYEDAGLDVSIGEGQGSSVTAKLVGNGTDTFGAVGASVVLTAASQGVPIKSVATMVPQTPTALVVPKDANADGLDWMYGKKIGAPVKSFVYNEYRAILKLNDLDASKIREVHTESIITEPLLAGQIDGGIGVTYVDGILPALNGTEVDTIKFADLGLDVPSLTLVANTRTIEESPDVVEAFVAASLKGWEDVRADPDEAFEIFMEHNPEADEAFNKAKLPLVLEHMFSGDNFGENDATKWENLKQIYTDLELLGNPVELDEVFTNEFLP